MDKNRDRSRITDTGRIFFITRMFFVKIFDFFFSLFFSIVPFVASRSILYVSGFWNFF